MHKRVWFIGAAVLIGAAASGARAHDAKDLPAGPIRERHLLMEGIGKNAKIIGDAVKAHIFGPESHIGPAAQEIEASAAKIPGLFPPGSTNPKSRAKPEIWSDWKKFEETAKLLETRAGELANEVQAGGNVAAKADEMFATCKTCHDAFRAPEKKVKK